MILTRKLKKKLLWNSYTVENDHKDNGKNEDIASFSIEIDLFAKHCFFIHRETDIYIQISVSIYKKEQITPYKDVYQVYSVDKQTILNCKMLM